MITIVDFTCSKCGATSTDAVTVPINEFERVCSCLTVMDAVNVS